MSKSLGNAIYLKDSSDELWQKIRQMYTDPNHIRIEDPGEIEGNTCFMYLDAFGDDKQKIQDLKDHYQRGGLGDMVVKKYLMEVLDEKLKPIRERRELYSTDTAQVVKILKNGTESARQVVAQTMADAKKAMGINYKLL
jgi:tryptophanyl-tRNA synthetase